MYNSVKFFLIGGGFLKLKLFAIFFPFLAFAVFFMPARAPIAPYVSGDTFRAYCDFAYDETMKCNAHSIKPGSTVFLNPDFLDDFFTKVHPFIRCKYILVSHNSDHSVPGAYRDRLDDERLVAWFGQNVDDTVHPKLHPLPIGLENRPWKPENVEVIQRVSSKHLPKIHLAYYNFSHTSYAPERMHVKEILYGAPFCYHSERKNYEPYIEDLASSKFVLSPRGNGIDTHRFWETLYAGSYPVVRRSSLDRLYEELPVAFVDDWSEVTEEFLNAQYEELSSKTFSLDKLYTEFWLKWIDEYKNLSR